MSEKNSSTTYCGKRHLPLPEGPYVVGCIDYMSSYSKDGCFVRIYYPTAEQDVMEQTDRWPKWIPRDEYYSGYAQFMNIWPFLFKTVFKWASGGDVYVPCVSDAELLGEPNLLPVVVFSHGIAGCRTSYSVVCCELASHGFVVVALEHRDRSACLSYYLQQPESDTDEKTSTQQVWVDFRHAKPDEDEGDVRNEQIFVREKEMKNAVDLIEKLNSGEYPVNVLDVQFDLNQFKGRLDLHKIASVGHSFGGGTVLLTLVSEIRFKVGVALDGWLLPLRNEFYGLIDKIHKPVLFINMDNRQTNESLKAMRAFVETKTEEERKLYKIRGSVHQSQADTPFLVSGWVREWAGASSSLDPHIIMALNNRLMLRFLWKHLEIPEHPGYMDYLGDHKMSVVENAFHVDA